MRNNRRRGAQDRACHFSSPVYFDDGILDQGRDGEVRPLCGQGRLLATLDHGWQGGRCVDSLGGNFCGSVGHCRVHDFRGMMLHSRFYNLPAQLTALARAFKKSSM
jgi:hypothetical protein